MNKKFVNREVELWEELTNSQQNGWIQYYKTYYNADKKYHINKVMLKFYNSMLDRHSYYACSEVRSIVKELEEMVMSKRDKFKVIVGKTISEIEPSNISSIHE